MLAYQLNRQIPCIALTGFVLLTGLPMYADEPQVIRIRMTATDDGTLADLILNGETITRPKEGKRTRFDVLQTRIRGLVEDAMGRRKEMDFEAELDCDYHLQYRHVIEAVTAVSGYTAKPSDKEVVKLIDKIKFASPRRAPNSDLPVGDHNEPENGSRRGTTRLKTVKVPAICPT